MTKTPYYTIKDHVKLGFDPETAPAEDRLKEIFADEIARTLWLTWRPLHIVEQNFGPEVLERAERIRQVKPKTPQELHLCLYRWFKAHSNFTEDDCRRFSEVALPYFTGEKKITFEIVI